MTPQIAWKQHANLANFSNLKLARMGGTPNPTPPPILDNESSKPTRRKPSPKRSDATRKRHL